MVSLSSSIEGNESTDVEAVTGDCADGYGDRIRALYLAAMAGALPSALIRLGPGRSVTDPNRWVLWTVAALKRRKANMVRAEQVGNIRLYLRCAEHYRDAAEDLNTVAEWWGKNCQQTDVATEMKGV